MSRGSAEYVLIWYSTNSSKPAASTTNSAASTTKSTADANYLPANSRPAFGSLPSAPLKPPYPRPQENQIFVYLLRFCPQQTGVCFGCGNSLKDNGIISPPLLDLVLVSKMKREWVFGGQLFSKVCNVYFHCHIQCVRRKQSYANPRAFIVTPEIRNCLETSHVNFLREYLGIVV